MNYIYGTNLDAPQSRNGSGKCVHPDTKINIEIEDEETLLKFKNFLNKK